MYTLSILMSHIVVAFFLVFMNGYLYFLSIILCVIGIVLVYRSCVPLL